MAQRINFEDLKDIVQSYTLSEIIEIWYEAKTGTFTSIDNILDEAIKKTK